MNNRLLHPPTIELPSNQFEAPLRMDVQAFLDFSFWMSEELLELEAQHAPLKLEIAGKYHSATLTCLAFSFPIGIFLTATA